MTWFKVDDTFAFHRKIVAAGNAACGLWARAGSWSAGHLTDGFVPDHMVRLLGSPSQRRKLISVGLWIEVDGGVQFHEWGEIGRQPSSESVRDLRRRNAERQAEWRARKSGKAQVGGLSDSVTPPVTPSVTAPVSASAPTRPDPYTSPKGDVGALQRPARATRIPDDFAVTEAMVGWARENAPDVDGRRETDRFRDYWRGVSGASATKRDWPATWRNWMRKAQDDIESRKRPHLRAVAGDEPRRDPRTGVWMER